MGLNTDFFNSKGILHQTSYLETPCKMVLLREKHQHILNIARALLFQSQLQNHFGPKQYYIQCFSSTDFLLLFFKIKHLLKCCITLYLFKQTLECLTLCIIPLLWLTTEISLIPRQRSVYSWVIKLVQKAAIPWICIPKKSFYQEMFHFLNHAFPFHPSPHLWMIHHKFKISLTQTILNLSFLSPHNLHHHLPPRPQTKLEKLLPTCKIFIAISLLSPIFPKWSILYPQCYHTITFLQLILTLSCPFPLILSLKHTQ